GLIVAERDKVGDDRFISHDEVAGMHRAVDRGLDALLEVGDEVAGIATQDFIATLAAQHDLAPRSRQAGDHELGKGTWAGNRLVEVINDTANVLHEVASCQIDFMKGKMTVPSHFASIAAFIVLGADAELARKTFEIGGIFSGGEAGDDAGVQAAADI